MSTRVGGVPEILPENMTSFAEPEEDGMSYFLLSFSISDAVFIADVFRAISDAIEIISDGKHDLIRAHERIKMFYDWTQVAERTEVVHDTVVKSRQTEFWERRRGSFGRPAPSILLMLSDRMMGFSCFWSGGSRGTIWISLLGTGIVIASLRLVFLYAVQRESG